VAVVLAIALKDASKVYIGTMVVLVATIAVSALSLREDKPKAFWTLAVGTIVLLIVAGAIWFVWG
jgi:hypothetical protein